MRLSTAVDARSFSAVRDLGELDLVDEVGEPDELERVAQRGALQHGTDLDGRVRRVRRPRQSQPRQPDARLAVDVGDRRRAFDEDCPGRAGPLPEPDAQLGVLHERPKLDRHDRCAVGSTRDSQIDAT